MALTRPDWRSYFMEIAHVVAKRSTCVRRQVGAVAVIDHRILATGYNGVPAGISHCTSETCLRKKYNVPSGERHELCRGVHAEQNVIVQAAEHGISLKGATLYCTNYPCSVCAKMIINLGIKEVIYDNNYQDTLAKQLFEESGVVVTALSANM